jgi:hypothetical protein
MSNLIRSVKSVAAVLFAVLIAACSSSNNSATPVHLRFVNATPASTLSVTLNGNGQFSGVTAGTATGYAQVTPSNYTIEVTSSNGALATSTQVLGLASGQTYTVLAYQRDGAIVAELVVEDQTLPASGYATIAVSNSSPDPGTLDVYIVPPGTTSLTGLSPTFQQVVFGAAPSATTMVSGTYDIVATATGNPSDVRSRLSSVSFASTQILMAAYTSTGGGALVDAVLLTQGSSVQFKPATQARVRAVSALPVAGATPVVATVGGTTLANVYSPVAGLYALVTGGTSTYSVTVNGTPVATLPAATFAAGGDFTILVYGSASSPSVAVFTDNNQAPIGSDINLRLVNAAVNVAGGLTLYDNQVQVASSVPYGQASTYFGVVGSSTSTLEVIEPGATPVSLSISLNAPGAVYTVFVIDSTLMPYPIRDR